ncbi:hypothetical protein SLOPH_1686 [Spraguea lophii 42_110]|uniref:Uncharacterized protein n=1 Tax=Spraguea lophii (strain 42_110) TaxID=1358809 RepID=S7XQE3_SPRLO|nr:hypothetical protein SLOPH_1686 [Spraguea lophii 42_110]
MQENKDNLTIPPSQNITYKQENEELKKIIIKLQQNNSLLETKNNELEQKNTELKQKNTDLEEKINTLKSTDKNILYREKYYKLKNYINGLLGYKIEFSDNEIILLSSYAYDCDDIIKIKTIGDVIQLETTAFLQMYEHEVNEYLAKRCSWPALLAAITLDLESKKTFN